MLPVSRSVFLRLSLVVLIGTAVFLPATAIRTAAQASGPVAAYAFSEGTGTTTADSSGNGNTATLQSGVGWGPGYFGHDATFSGSSVSVSAPSNGLSGITSAFTLEAWVQLGDLQQTRTVLSFAGGTQI